MKKPLPTPETPPPTLQDAPQALQEPEGVLGQHHAALSTLSTELDALQRLSDRWRDLSAELAAQEAQLESTASGLLSGQSDDAQFAALSDKVAAIEARIRAVRKLVTTSGSSLQRRLPLDIGSVEWLAQNFLQHRLQTEVNTLLLTIAPDRRGTVREHATALALVGTAYCASVEQLGTAIGENYSWTRPLDAPESEKSALSQKLIRDPMFTPVDPKETLSNLLTAGRGVQTRWSALLIAVGLDPAFEMPSYEQPKAEEWRPTKEQTLAGIGGPPTPGIPLENPAQKRLHYAWEASELAHPPWEKQAS